MDMCTIARACGVVMTIRHPSELYKNTLVRNTLMLAPLAISSYYMSIDRDCGCGPCFLFSDAVWL